MKYHNMVMGVLVLALSLMTISIASAGTVYTMTNNQSGNEVISYDRVADGTLSLIGSFSTDGLGTGSSLGDQGGLILSDDGSMLLAVNAGSNEISVFRVKSNSLILTDKVSSGGATPISITIHKNLVYVLNAGSTKIIGNIVGYNLNSDGTLSKISGSTQLLSNIPVSPAEISFNPDGTVLAVTEKTTNLIDTYTVDNDGVAHGPIIHDSNGQTPFGFAFDKRGHLIVSEAATNALSSYAVGDDGSLTTISGSIIDLHLAPCWVAITKDGKFAYTNNAHDGTTSSYTISHNGVLTLLNPIAGSPGAGNIDLALSDNSDFLYSLNSNGEIVGFKVNPDGSLTNVGKFVAPVGVEGLAAR